MATSEVLCLANSPKEHARCIAGIDLRTHQFVRPVAIGSQSIPEAWAKVDGRQVKPLDVVRISFARGNAVVPYQSENRYCTDGWQRVARWQASDVHRFCESDARLLGTPGPESIPERFFRLRQPRRSSWKSLQLIHAPEVEFSRSGDKWTGRFRTREGRHCEMRVTDENFTQSLREPAKRRCILLLSLTRPWRHYLAPKSKPKKCYKLIAGVMPL